jgi:peptide/nickel transport system substrate-binding protein
MTGDRPDQRRAPPGLPTSTAAGALSRRDVLRRGGALGAGAVVLRALGGEVRAASPDGSAPRGTVVRGQGDGATLTIASFGPPSDLDPHAAQDYLSAQIILGVYERLIGLKGAATDQYEGILAETWEANADKSVWTFHLRDGVAFQDGSPLDAEAVRASFERLLSLGLGPANVIGRFVADPRQITAPDARTVVFDLGRPRPLFEAAIASTYGPEIVNVAALRAHDAGGDWGRAWAQTNAVGTGSGPYRIVEYEPDDGVVLERFDGYWRGWDGNHLERIVIRVVPEEQTRRELIEQGAVDIVDNLTAESIDALRDNPHLDVVEHTSTQVQYFIMTCAGPLQTAEARRALCYAFPYREVVEGAYGGHGKQAVGAVAEVVRGFAPETFRYDTDLAMAKALVGRAGVASGTRLRLVLAGGDEKPKTAAQLFQSNLARIGLSVEIELMDTASYTGLLYGGAPPEDRPNLMWWGWWPDYNDAWDHLYPQVSCNAEGAKGANAGFYCNHQVEALLSQAETAPTIDDYALALSRLQQIVSHDDPPAIYYIQPTWTTVLRKNVTGFVFNPITIGTYDFWTMGRVSG